MPVFLLMIVSIFLFVLGCAGGAVVTLFLARIAAADTGTLAIPARDDASSFFFYFFLKKKEGREGALDGEGVRDRETERRVGVRQRFIFL